ncbi:hypothetical protein Q9966_001527 [Columba livia]|nr:hypothetical protein Q9966_001527 [Columba livia]
MGELNQVLTAAAGAQPGAHSCSSGNVPKGKNYMVGSKCFPQLPVQHYTACGIIPNKSLRLPMSQFQLSSTVSCKRLKIQIMDECPLIQAQNNSCEFPFTEKKWRIRIDVKWSKTGRIQGSELVFIWLCKSPWAFCCFKVEFISQVAVEAVLHTEQLVEQQEVGLQVKATAEFEKEILGWRDLLKCILQASGKTLQKLPSTTATSVGVSVEAEHQGATCGVLGQPVYEL